MINVIIPAYNCRRTLERTLASLIAQTDKRFEVILVDDCSTEDIKGIVDEYFYSLKIWYIRNDKNLGCGMSRQVGMDNATQKYVTFLDADDMFMPYTVETFNAVISEHPETEYLHTHFYQQIVVDESPAMVLHKDNYTACHGKLYNLEAVRKHGIRNSPEVRWADDSYFNSMCGELLKMSIIGIPTMLWTSTPDSVLRKPDPERDSNIMADFVNAMIMSAEFVVKRKGYVEHLHETVEQLKKKYTFTEEENARIEALLGFGRK